MTEPHDLNTHDLNTVELRDRAVRAVRGAGKFDIAITGGTLVDVVTGELRRAEIGLVGPLIAAVLPADSPIEAHADLDARGRFVAPGLIDSHLHVESSMVTPRHYAETVVPQGTTTICWDPHELGNVLGLDGVRWAIDASRDLPLRVMVLAPSCVPSAPGLERAGAHFGAAEMQAMLGWPDIAGVAEVMDMRGVLERSAHMVGIVGAGLDSGKLVCGHGRGLAGADLQAFAAAGIESDHEITSGDDLLAKLRAGFTVELRGSHDYVLPGVVQALRSLPVLPQSLTICTDDVFPDDLADAGGMIDVLRRLVRYGMAPVDVLRAATLHAATRLGRRDLGAIAPGRRADLIVLSDLQELAVEHVFASGRHVAAHGALRTPLRADPVPLPRDTVKLALQDAAAFRLTAPDTQAAAARLRTVVQPRFTSWGEVGVTLRNGIAALPDDALMMAMLHRHGVASPQPRIGVLQGWGEWRGAFATTVSHDSHNLAVFGRDAADMAAAANAVIMAQGGMAVARGGVVRALLPLPVCGLLSDSPTSVVAEQFRALKRAAEEIADLPAPLMVVKACVGASLACNPGPHVTDVGIADGTTGEIFGSAFIEAA